MRYLVVSKIFILAMVVVVGIFVNACMPRTIKAPQNSSEPLPEGYALYFYQTRFANLPDSANFSYSTAEFLAKSEIKLFYQRRLFKLAWTNMLFPTPAADSLLYLLENSQEFGLSPNFYNTSIIKTLRQQFSDSIDLYHQLEYAANFELLLSNAAFTFARHLNRGLLHLDSVGYRTKPDMLKIDLTTVVNNGIKGDSVISSILGLQPKALAYINLINSFRWFILNNDRDTISIKIPDPQEDSIRAYHQAKKVLIKNGFLIENKNKSTKEQNISTNDFSSDEFYNRSDIWENDDSVFVNALKIFQRFNGLNQDGKIGKFTRQSLEKTNNEKYWQILLAIDKLKWESKLPSKYIYVNIPSYVIRVIINDSILKEHKIVVGLPSKQTPVFTDTMEYFITYPEWNVPLSISYHEILPKLRVDTTYTDRNNYLVYDKDLNAVNVRDIDWSLVNRANFEYSIKQARGNSNALGTIKFIFPNEHYVYIHDTPSKQYFSRDIRAYSHGCVRLQSPWEFAEFLVLQDKRENFLDTLIDYKKRRLQRHIMLQDPIPVLMRYITVDADDKNNLFFYKDVYVKDKYMIEELQQKFR